jgi:hypothetical protein
MIRGLRIAQLLIKAEIVNCKLSNGKFIIKIPFFQALFPSFHALGLLTIYRGFIKGLLTLCSKLYE